LSFISPTAFGSTQKVRSLLTSCCWVLYRHSATQSTCIMVEWTSIYKATL
jgi:hypothetical protein